MATIFRVVYTINDYFDHIRIYVICVAIGEVTD